MRWDPEEILGSGCKQQATGSREHAEARELTPGVREKSGSGSYPWAIRSEVIRWLIWMCWIGRSLRSTSTLGSFCRKNGLRAKPGLEAGSEQPVGRETAVQTPGKSIP